MSQKRNIAGDKRAASLTLQPRPPQRNTFGRGFEFTPALTDIDHCERNRIQQCIAMRNDFRSKAP
jgi:hypothetical protein